jgi:hypothetical protein
MRNSPRTLKKGRRRRRRKAQNCEGMLDVCAFYKACNIERKISLHAASCFQQVFSLSMGGECAQLGAQFERNLSQSLYL